MGLAKGIEAEADASVRFGADLYIAGSRFGRPPPLPVRAVERVRLIEGVTRVYPRVVGEVILGKERVHAVLVGLPAEQIPTWSGAVEGALPRPGVPHQLVV